MEQCFLNSNWSYVNGLNLGYRLCSFGFQNDLLEIQCTYIKLNQPPLVSYLDIIWNKFCTPFSASISFCPFFYVALNMSRYNLPSFMTMFPSNLKFWEYGHLMIWLSFHCIYKCSKMLSAY